MHRASIFVSAILLTLSIPALAETPREGFQWNAIGALAVQERGRIKPLDTLANEAVLFVTGKRKWNNRPPIETVFGWLVTYEKEWENAKFVRVDFPPLKKAMGLPEDEKYFSPKELGDNPMLGTLLREADEKERRDERMNETEKRARQIQNQRSVIEAMATGLSWTMLPNPEGLKADWFPLASLAQQQPLPFSPEQISKVSDGLQGLIRGFAANDAKMWNEAVFPFVEVVRNQLAPNAYPSASELNREIHFNSLRPFQWAWIIYALAFILCLFHLTTKSNWSKYIALASLVGAFGLHSYGFLLRCLIAERPPVTNMYESVIWVTWGCVLFAFVIWAMYRNLAIPAAASVFAVAGLVLADNLPFVLDPGIHPLEPVLRSNFWLTIHVLTITLSYAAFALSLCLGNVVLGQYLFRPGNVTTIQTYSLYMYRAMQIGVVLLAAGTILGGVWADVSWGRFWGWDPKEVWALIALLLYLAVLHGRFAGWLKGFGFVTCTVMSFLGVLMAWYGVNFILGVGKHSYGFGTGGLGYVSSYIALQLAFVAAAYFRHRQHPGRESSAIFPKR